MIDAKSIKLIEELGQAIEIGNPKLIFNEWEKIKPILEREKLNKNQKECFNHCPQCDADFRDIVIVDNDLCGENYWEFYKCNKCGHDFSQIYIYSHTESDESVEDSIYSVEKE